MPWQETSFMDQRIQFIGDYQRGLLPIVELAERFGISRKTAYKWIGRYEDESYRDCRRAHSERGWSPWDDKRSTHLR